MRKNEFFDFRSELSSSTVQAHAVGLKKDEKGIDEHWNLVKGRFQDSNFPITFKQEYGKHLKDILDTGWPSLFLISEKLKKILEENNLSGWRVFPIQLLDKKGKLIPGYHGFSFIGRSGPTNYDNCEIFEKRRVPEGPLCKFYKGVFIDNWDGSDFFTPEGTYETFVTRKAADILKKHLISNLNLIDLAESEMEVRYVKK